MKKLIVLFLFIALSYSAYANGCNTYFEEEGTASEPILIENLNDLRELMDCPVLWHSHFLLVNDIDATSIGEYYPKPVGNLSTSFNGTFDGNGKTISNLNYQYSESAEYIGFFGKIGESGYVHDLNLKNITIQQGTSGDQIPNENGYNYYFFGGIAGWNAGKIHSCYVDGTVSGFIAVGGAVGANHGEILGTHAACTVYGAEIVGGFVGCNGFSDFDEDQIPNTQQTDVNKLIQGCSAKGNVIGVRVDSDYPSSYEYQGSKIGGFVGLNSQYQGSSGDQIGTGGLSCTEDPEYSIIECFSTGNVQGSEYVGGFVGRHACEHIESCYCLGNVFADMYAGGFAGFAITENSVNYCYSYGAASSTIQYEGGFVGLNDGNGYECCFWNTTANNGLDAVGFNNTTPDPPDGIDGLTEAEFADISNFSCMTDERPGVWVMGNNTPILYGTTLPTLSEWAVIIFIGLLAGVGGWFVWRRMV